VGRGAARDVDVLDERVLDDESTSGDITVEREKVTFSNQGYG